MKKKNKFNIKEEVIYQNNLCIIDMIYTSINGSDIEYTLINKNNKEIYRLISEDDLQVSPNATNVYYEGNPDRGKEIKADLERRSKIQEKHVNCCSNKDYFYYIKSTGTIGSLGCVYKYSDAGRLLKLNYHKLTLSDKPKLPIDFDAYTGFSSRIPNLGKLVILAYLMELRDIYNDGWKPCWISSSYYDYKYVIYNNMFNELETDTFKVGSPHIFTFKTIELRDKFYEAFKSQLEEIKELI